MAFLFAVLLLSPYLLLGEGAFVLLHDNLDSVGRYGTFVDGVLQQSGPHLDQWLFGTFGYFWGFVINEALVRIVGGAGLFLLLRRMVGATRTPSWLFVLIACAFVGLPHYPSINLTVVGLPMVALLLHNFHRGDHRLVSGLGLFGCAYHAYFFLAGFFLLVLVGIFVLVQWRRKSIPWGLVLGAGCFLLGSIAAHAPLFIEMSAVAAGGSNRSEMQVYQIAGKTFVQAVAKAWSLFTKSQYHAHSFHGPIILPSLLVLTAVLGWRKKLEVGKAVAALLGFAAFCSLLYGAYYWRPILEAYGRTRIGFNYSRFFFLLPPLWYLVWGLVLANAHAAFAKYRATPWILGALVVGQVGLNLCNSVYVAATKSPSYAEFVSADLFSEIRDHMELSGEDKVGCIGIHPSVARINGLPALGFYKMIYPLEAKREVEAIIRDELDASEEIGAYFRYWGSRVYLYDDEIGRALHDQPALQQRVTSIESKLNIEALRDAKVRYLISMARIRNVEELGLTLVFSKDDPAEYYRLFVYRVP